MEPGHSLLRNARNEGAQPRVINQHVVLTGKSSSASLGGELVVSEERTHADGSIKDRFSPLVMVCVWVCAFKCFARVFSSNLILACSSLMVLSR